MSAQTLKLVDMDGKYAPVKVVATTEEAKATTGSRAVSNDGKWNLTLSMLDTVTEEDIETAFTKEVNGVAQNLCYALTVNGTRVTGYSFVIDTQTKNETETNTAYTKDDLINKTAQVEAGESTLTLADFEISADEAANVVLSSLTLADVNAEAAGVTVDGMSVNVPTSYTGQYIKVKLAVLDVTGATSERDAYIKVIASTSSSVDQIKQIEVSVSASGEMVIPFGEIFSKLDASVAKEIVRAQLAVADANFFALNSTVADNNTGLYDITDSYTVIDEESEAKAITLYKNAEMKDDQVVDLSVWDKSDVRSIVCAKVVLPKNEDGQYITGANDIVNIYGTFDLQFTLLDSSANVLKKIIVPVKVVAPTFDEYFTKNTNAAWVNGAISKELAKDGANVVALGDADKLFIDIAAESAAKVGNEIKEITYDYAFKAANDVEATFDNAAKPAATTIQMYPTYEDGTTTMKKDNHPILKEKLISDGSNGYYKTGRYTLNNAKVSARATSTVAKVLVKGAEESIKVSEVFDLNFTTPYSNAKLAYYVNDVVADKAVVNNDNTIFGYKELIIEKGESDDKNVKAYTGLALIVGDEDPVAVSLDDITSVSTLSLNSENKWSESAEESPLANKFVAAVVGGSSIGTVVGTSGAITIQTGDSNDQPLLNGQGGTLSLQIVDALGVQTDLKIDYVKQDIATPADVQ